jgi:hypothetical protein
MKFTLLKDPKQYMSKISIESAAKIAFKRHMTLLPSIWMKNDIPIHKSHKKGTTS